MKLRIKKFSYRFAEQVLNSKLIIKNEIEDIIINTDFEGHDLTRPKLNKKLEEILVKKGWIKQPVIFDEPGDPTAKMDFLKERIGMEVGFTHASFLGIDLLKFQVASYSGLDKIDAGVYITTTKHFQLYMKEDLGHKWEGSLTYEKVIKYLPHFKSAIQIPIYVLGIDI